MVLQSKLVGPISSDFYFAGNLPCLVEPNHWNDTNGILILLWLRRFWLIVGVDEGFDPGRVE